MGRRKRKHLAWGKEVRILCRHGHFSFYPKDAREISRFATLFSEELEREGDFYTFAFLKDAPNYSLQGKSYLGLPATVTFEGLPWEVMRENGFVYNIALKTLVPKLTVVTPVFLDVVDDFYTTDNPIIQPGSIEPSGQQVLSYDAEYFGKASQLQVFEVGYE